MSPPEQSGHGPPRGGPRHTGGSPSVHYERRGAAALITIDRQHRRNAVDGPTAAALHDAYLRFEADEEARVLVLTGAGGVSFCAGADLKATRDVRRAAHERGGADGLHSPDGVQADDRRDLRLLPGRWPGAGAVVRSAHRDRDIHARLPRAPLGRPPDRRRDPAPTAHRRARSRARADPHRAHDRRQGGAVDRSPDRGRAARQPTWSARSRSPRGSRASPSARCSPTAARRSRVWG